MNDLHGELLTLSKPTILVCWRCRRRPAPGVEWRRIKVRGVAHLMAECDDCHRKALARLPDLSDIRLSRRQGART